MKLLIIWSTLILKIKSVCSSELSLNVYNVAWHTILEDNIAYSCDNLFNIMFKKLDNSVSENILQGNKNYLSIKFGNISVHPSLIYQCLNHHSISLLYANLKYRSSLKQSSFISILLIIWLLWWHCWYEVRWMTGFLWGRESAHIHLYMQSSLEWSGDGGFYICLCNVTIVG
jgi:hypothetical protein